MRFLCASRDENTRCNETEKLLYKDGYLYASNPCMGMRKRVEGPDGYLQTNGTTFYVDPVFLNNLKATKNTPAIAVRANGSITSCHTDEGKPFTVRADEPFNDRDWDVEQLWTHLETGNRRHHFTVNLANLRRLLKSLGPCHEDTALEFHYDDSVKPVHKGPLKEGEHKKCGVLIKATTLTEEELTAEAVVMPIIREER